MSHVTVSGSRRVPETTVGVVGAGVSGMAMGLALQAAGVPFTIFEKASEVGGTWRENRYPGLSGQLRGDLSSPTPTAARASARVW
jgi:NADPH-dependent 2,4-dienoyl-CoA reductase/sulfur reductase-like enzyme